MDEGQISAIIPVYNLYPFIGEAVASIKAQTRPVQEIIVIDDGSTDETQRLIGDLARADPRLRILRSERRGPSSARNLGLRAATGRIIAFLDGDDLWPRDKIEQQMKRLAAPDRPHVVSGLIQRFERLDPVSLAPADEQSPGLPGANVGASLFRRQVFDRVGPFDESLTYSEDHDLMLRIREAGLTLAIIRRATLYYRRRIGSMTKAASAPRDFQLLKVLRLSIARRRRSGESIHLAPLSSFVDR